MINNILQLRIARENKFLNPTIPNTKKKINVKIKIFLRLLSGLHTLYRCKKAVNPVMITDNVDISDSLILNILPTITTINIFTTIVNAEGIAFAKILIKKLLLNCSLFGSKAKINDGIPMVKALVKVN